MQRATRYCLALLVVLAIGGRDARSQTWQDNSLFVPVVPAGGDDPCASQSFVESYCDPETGKHYQRWTTTGPGAGVVSAGWHNLVACYPQEGGEGHGPFTTLPWFPSGEEDAPYIPAGFRIGRSLLAAPSPGDFLPVGRNLAEHSTALLPPGGGAIGTDWQGSVRQTLGGKVDLVTGLPLVQVTDLELPFGGAVFRLNRTRSGMREDAIMPGEYGNWISGPDQWWDWAGMGWMMSENPLLLIDSSLPDVTGDQPKTCYFIVDAHHSIPFQLIEANGVYEAPPRFRARMTHNGDWDQETYSWAAGKRPTQFDIYLYDGALHYTFVAIWEDVPLNRWNNIDGDGWEYSSHNDRPILPQRAPNGSAHDPLSTNMGKNPGVGIPYYGLCTRIEDKQGHCVEIDYMPVAGSAMDDVGTIGQVECQRRTTQKGQIRSIRLKSNGVVEWTLVYVHRMFRGVWIAGEDSHPYMDLHGAQSDPMVPDEWPEEWWGLVRMYGEFEEGQQPDDQYFENHGHVAIDRIYVYKHGLLGDDELSLAESHLSIPHTDADVLAGNGIDPMSELNLIDAEFGRWRHQIRYFYEENPSPNEPSRRPLSPPLLIHTEMTAAHRDEQGVARPQSVHRVYQYDLEQGEDDDHSWAQKHAYPEEWEGVEPYHIPWLRFVFEDADLVRLADEWSSKVNDGAFDYNALGRNRSTATGVMYNADVLANYASLEMTPHEMGGTDYPVSTHTADAPRLNDLIGVTNPDTQQIILNKDYLRNDGGYAAVKDISYFDAEGIRRHYRINRFRNLPAVVGSGGFGGGFAEPVGEHSPFRSVFAHPYYWQTYDPLHNIGAPPPLVEEVTLHEARWIPILDEYVDRETLKDPSARYNYSEYKDDDYGTRAGQVGRRIVELNPAGYLLRERSWEFHADGTVATGRGLGEHFIYASAESYFESVGNPFPAPTDTNDDGLVNGKDEDPWRLVRGETLLVQHRSVGWSAGWMGNDPDDEIDEAKEGLVRFYEYEYNDTENFSFLDWPASARMYLVAEGIQKGSGEGGQSVEKYYTRQVARDPDRPMDVVAEIEFTKGESCSTLLQAPWPQPLGEPLSEGVVIRQHRAGLYPMGEDETEDERKVNWRSVIGAPRQTRPGGPWYYPLEIEFYDTDGNSEWAASGLVQNPLDPWDAALEEDTLIFTYYQREGGLTRFTVVDAGAGGVATSSSGEQITLPDPPLVGEEEWTRIGEGVAKNAVTEFVYHDDYGLVDIFMPNDRRWSKRVVVKSIQNSSGDTIEFAREYIFNDLYRTSGNLAGETDFYTGSPGEINDYPGEEAYGDPRLRRRVMFLAGESGGLSLPEHGPQPGGGLAAIDYWQVQMALDANGRPQEATLLEPDINGALIAVGSKMYNDLGELTREQEIDGTITRVTKNALGFALRTYVGTRDSAWVDVEPGGGGAPHPDSYDMILVDRTEYGAGVEDAWLPTVFRQYRSLPAGQDDWTLDHHGAAPVSDTDGYATITAYDWRMRPVRTETYAKGDPSEAARLSTVVTYLDHADRPCLVVTYGEGVPDLSGLDPTGLTGAEQIPEPAAFYSLGIGLVPTSLTSMEYGFDGTLTERRSYDVAWTGSGEIPFQAEYTYAGKGGQVVYSQSPGQPVTINVLDSFGRVASTRSLRPDLSATGVEYELARTDYTYDGDGNVSETAQWTRVEAEGDSLDGSNAVRTRSVSWYDAQKRLVASAELGTEDGDDGWVYASPSYVYSNDSGDTPSWDEATGVFRGNLPPDAQLWISVYDIYGNQTHAVDPAGVVTQYEFGPTGRMIKKTENATGPPAEQRTTEYGYEWGRVVSLKMARTLNNIGELGEEQTSRVIYADEDTDGPCNGSTGCEDSRVGAEVVDEDFNRVSRTTRAVRWLELLGASEPSGDHTNPDLTFRYTFDGQVAERIDARRVSFRYRYDALGRVDSIQVGHYQPGSAESGNWTPGYPESMNGPNGQAPADRVGYLDYIYHPRGGLTEVLSYDRDPADGGLLITHNRYEFDIRGDILADWQSQGQAIDEQTTPHTQYAWHYERTDLSTGRPGAHRLTSMLYPSHDGSTPRDVQLLYGGSGSDDDLLSRISSVTSSFGSAAEIATFDYVGVGRRSRMALADQGIVQSYKTSMAVGLAGLDAFGRSRDLHFTNATFQTLFRAEYSYDTVGNRLTAKLTQAPAGGSDGINHRSQLNAYDSLNRLSGTEVGSLDGLPSAPFIQAGTRIRQDQWNLDLLGNWTGGSLAGSPDAGRASSGNLDGWGSAWAQPGADEYDDQWDLTHSVDDRNQLTLTHLDLDEQEVVEAAPIYDGAGNLKFDGSYYFQYDAWNRVVQVNHATDDGAGGVVMGQLAKHFMYDGLGRLVRTQAPAPSESLLRTERFYYDGLRRIQELVTDPVTPLGGAAGDPGLEALASQTVPEGSNPDEQTAPSGFEQGQLGMGGGSGGTVEREYIWGPGDNGFDELLVQYDAGGNEAWAIQDGGGDLVALCDLKGLDNQGSPSIARVVGQWTYDAYGEVLSAEHLFAFSLPRLGHKGLFLDRLDGSAAGPRLVPFGHALYHMRNRAYAPGLGRFLQRDPNQTAMALAESAAMHGRGLGSLSLAFDLEGLYGDGGNLYEYLGSSPWQRSDVLGLSWDPFDMVDEYLAESSGNSAALLERLGQTAKALAVTAAHIMTYLPFPAASIAGELALVVLGEQDLETAMEQIALGLIPGGKLVGAAGRAIKASASVIGKAVGRTSIYASTAAIHYAAKGGPRLAGAMTALGAGAKLAAKTANKATAWLKKGRQTRVYIGVVGHARIPRYVGITSQSKAARMAKHNARRPPLGLPPFSDLEWVTPNPVPRNTARAIEQVLFMANPHFDNSDNPISMDHDIFQGAVNAGVSWLRNNGKPFCY
ncbi:MAG: hypothetical protein IT431_18335 [Phycisphaerales bacterium]|nr:hypothetical protein [Phycisphaerales bacterium]